MMIMIKFALIGSELQRRRRLEGEGGAPETRVRHPSREDFFSSAKFLSSVFAKNSMVVSSIPAHDDFTQYTIIACI